MTKHIVGETSPHFSIREIMAYDPAFTSPDTPVSEAAGPMSHRKIGAGVVCDREKIVGILTERDLLRAVAGGQRPDKLLVCDLMTRAPFTIDANASWTTAADLMVKHAIRHLPVVEEGRLVGMLSVRDLMEHR